MIARFIAPYVYPILIVAFIAWSGWIGSKAYRWGVNVEAARNAEATQELNTELVAKNKTLLKAQSDLLASERENEDLEVELNNAARNDPNADRLSIGTDGVRRLNQSR